MKFLFTGAFGFLGNNVRPFLERMYDVTTIGLLPQDDYTVNIAKEIPDLDERYDIVLHAAGKAHSVPRTEAEKQVFFDVNLQGTKNLCTALERRGVPRAFIFISTVAVYGCAYGENITEDHPLNGDTPYAMSKRLAEEYLQKWCYEHNVILGIIRPSLITGPNPPGNLGAMIHGIRSGKYLSIAGGRARKSVLMVQDIAKLVPLLAEREASTMYVIVITRLSENLRLLFAGNWIRNCLYQYRTGWLNAWLWQVIAWEGKLQSIP